MGAIVLRDRATAHQMPRVQKSIGKGMRQASVLNAAAWAAIEESFGKWLDIGKPVWKEVHEWSIY